jgi:hypothetical protein
MFSPAATAPALANLQIHLLSRLATDTVLVNNRLKKSDFMEIKILTYETNSPK